jgi:hypothetical protein
MVNLRIWQDLKELLDNSKLYLLRWADEYTDLVQGGFQELFTNLVDHFLFLCVRSVETPLSLDKSQSPQTVTPSLILLVSLLSVYLYQTAVPRITEVSTCLYSHHFAGFQYITLDNDVEIFNRMSSTGL